MSIRTDKMLSLGRGIRSPASVAYLDSSSKQMSIMRKTGGKGRSIIERKLRSTLGELQTRLESIDLSPELDDLFLFLRKVERSRH